MLKFCENFRSTDVIVIDDRQYGKYTSSQLSKFIKVMSGTILNLKNIKKKL